MMNFAYVTELQSQIVPVQNFVRNSADFREFSWDHVLGSARFYCAKARSFVLFRRIHTLLCRNA